jgi:hypothetical protein
MSRGKMGLISRGKGGVPMSRSQKAAAAIHEQVSSPLFKNDTVFETSAFDSGCTSAFEMRIQHATARDLLSDWDCDLSHLSHSPIHPDLKPLTAEELEGLVTKFPHVMPHIYVRPDAILFGIAGSDGNLVEVRRDELVLPGEVRICDHVRTGVHVWEWCGDISGSADVLAFNRFRVNAIHQTLVLSRPNTKS